MLCLGFICVFSEASAIEEEIGTSAASVVQAGDLYWSAVEPNGQGVVLTGAALDLPAREAAAMRAEQIWGLTRVVNEIRVIGSQGACQQDLNAQLSIEPIRFKSGRADLAASSESVIPRLAMILRACEGLIEIAGHTDSHGDAAINLRLSQRRADRVAKYLVNHGVAAGQVRSRGYGERQPVSSNSSPEGRKLNRRIEFRVLGGTA